MSFSEQSLVNCVYDYDGCEGGDSTDAFDYWEDHSPILADVYKPYTAIYGSCDYGEYNKYQVNVSSWKEVRGTAKAMKTALSKGPTKVSIQADADSFHLYSGGVYDDSECGHVHDHAVVLVGWGTDQPTGQEYYILRNSWGTTWGE